MASHPKAFFKEILEGKGFVRKENLFDKRTPSRLADVANWLYVSLTEVEKNGTAESKETKYLIHTNQVWGGLQMELLAGYLSERSPKMLDRFMRAKSDVIERVSLLLGKGWILNENGSVFRRMNRPGSSVGWHSDAEAANTLDAGQQAVTVWVPLVEVGGSMPSLEFVTGSQRKMRQPSTPMPSNRVRTEEWVDQEFDGAKVALKAKPRDALMFDEFTLHRTQQMSNPIGVRTSCEFRFVRPGAPRQPEDVAPVAHIPDSTMMDVVRGLVAERTGLVMKIGRA